MKRIALLLMMAMPSILLVAQEAKIVSPGVARYSATEDSIRNTALDYADGFYTGNAARMESAVHPDLNKAFPRFIARTGQSVPTYTTYSQLIGYTEARVGLLADTARHIQVSILHYTPEVAMVKVLSANFNDYLQMIKDQGKWKIINVLWNGGPQNAAARTKDMKEAEEKKAVEQLLLNYLAGIQNADMQRLSDVLAGDFNRVLMVPIAQTGKTSVQRQRTEVMLKNAYSGAGRQEESQRDNSVEVLDMMDGMAMARVQSVNLVEYLQLYKDGKQWKIFNCLLTNRKDNNLSSLLPAIEGEPMPDFTLPVFGGGTFKLSENKGKNVLLLFPRGFLGRTWCTYCPYQYLDLAEIDKLEQVRKKLNLEIIFVMPYGSDKIADWFAKFPETMRTLEGLKNPQGNPAGIQKEFSDWVRIHYPKTFDLKQGVPDKAFPVLIDEKRTLSKQLKLFTNFWDGVQAEQNIASVYFIDKNGILKWKYVGQMTEDRPSTDYILKVVKEAGK